MKTSMKAHIIVEAPTYSGFNAVDRTGGEEITLGKIREIIATGHYTLEWINSDLDNDVCPTLIIKL